MSCEFIVRFYVIRLPSSNQTCKIQTRSKRNSLKFKQPQCNCIQRILITNSSRNDSITSHTFICIQRFMTVHTEVHEAWHLFSWGWRKLDILSVSAALLQLGAPNTRHTITHRTPSSGIWRALRLYSHLSWGFWEWCSYIWTSWSDSCWAAGRAFEPSGCLGVVILCVWMSAFMWRRVGRSSADLQVINSQHRRFSKSRRLMVCPRNKNAVGTRSVSVVSANSYNTVRLQRKNIHMYMFSMFFTLFDRNTILHLFFKKI